MNFLTKEEKEFFYNELKIKKNSNFKEIEEAYSRFAISTHLDFFFLTRIDEYNEHYKNQFKSKPKEKWITKIIEIYILLKLENNNRIDYNPEFKETIIEKYFKTEQNDFWNVLYKKDIQKDEQEIISSERFINFLNAKEEDYTLTNKLLEEHKKDIIEKFKNRKYFNNLNPKTKDEIIDIYIKKNKITPLPKNEEDKTNLFRTIKKKIKKELKILKISSNELFEHCIIYGIISPEEEIKSKILKKSQKYMEWFNLLQKKFKSAKHFRHQIYILQIFVDEFELKTKNRNAKTNQSNNKNNTNNQKTIEKTTINNNLNNNGNNSKKAITTFVILLIILIIIIVTFICFKLKKINKR